jgi:class 3 adenylate cyclase
MTFEEILDQALGMIQRRGRVTYRTLRRQFQLDDDALEDLKAEITNGQRLAVDEDGEVLVWTGDALSTPPPAAPTPVHGHSPRAYTPVHLTEKILASRAALEGKRKQATVLFADLKSSMELLADRDPEEARQLLDPVLDRMMAAVHQYEGTVNQVMGDGIMALFGAPIAHEDHAVRACYAALAMQEAVKQYAEAVFRRAGLGVQIRVGLNSGEVVVRAIGSDLRMDYTAVGQTTHLAARIEQTALPGTILLAPGTLRLAEGYVQVRGLGPIPIKGLAAPVEVYEVVGAGLTRTRLQAAVARGLTRLVGRDAEFEVLRQSLGRAGVAQGQIVARVGEPGVGKSRLVYEFLHSHHTGGWRVLESSSVSYGKATAYLPVCDLLKAYCHLEDRDDLRTVRAKITGHLSNGWRSTPCEAKCGTRPWPIAARLGRKPRHARPTARRWWASSRHSSPWSMSLTALPPPRRPLTSGAASPARSMSWEKPLGGCSTICAAPKPWPRRWATNGDSRGSTPT